MLVKFTLQISLHLFSTCATLCFVNAVTNTEHGLCKQGAGEVGKTT